MNYRKVKEIVKFNIEKNIQNKWFVIFNIFMFISIIIATNWNNISDFLKEHNINLINTSESFSIQVLDNENIIFDRIIEVFEKDENIKIEKVYSNKYTKENLPEDKTLLIDVKTDNIEIIKAKLVSKEGIDNYIMDKIYELLKDTRSEVFASKYGITTNELEVLNKEISLERVMLGVDGDNYEIKQTIKLISTIILYMCLILILGRIANEIANEKVSKSIEYVLTSVTAKEYLLAKVLSSTLTVVIQLVYTIIYYFIGNLLSNIFVTKIAMNSNYFSNFGENIDSSIITYILALIGYLIFTVFLTTLIQAALSSKTTNISEAGNTTMFLVFIVITLYFLSNSLINPYTKVSTVMYIISCIPIVSTFFVPSMMIIGQATTAQIIISFIVLIISIPVIFNYCAKIFKNGVLDYSTKKKGIFKFKKLRSDMSFREKQEIELKKNKAKRFAFTIGMAIMIFIVVQVIGDLIFKFIFNIYSRKIYDTSTLLLIENSILIISSLGLASSFIKVYNTENIFERKKISNNMKSQIIFIGIAFLTIIQIILSILLPKLGINDNIFEMAGLIPTNNFIGILVFFISLTIVPALFEELFFRKWILNYSKKFGNLFAVVFSALLFGIYHLNIGQGIFAFLIGILFGIIVIITGSIRLTVLLHFLNNLYAGIVMIAEDSIVLKFINSIILAISLVGIILMIKNISKIKNINKNELKINKDCKYLLNNYTFVVSMILLILLFVVTQKSLM